MAVNQFATVPSIVGNAPATSTPPRKTAAERLAEIRAEKAAAQIPQPQPKEKGFLRSLGEAIVKPVLTTGANIQYGVGKAASALAGAVGADGVKQNFDSDLARMRSQGVIGGFVRPDDTAGKAVGNALQSASLVVGGGATPNVVRQGFVKGIGAATKAYAPLGAASGAVGGAGMSLAEGNTDPLKIAGDTAVGTAIGAVAAPVLGGVGNVVGAGVRNAATKAAPGVISDALELTAPTLNKKASISAFENAGRPGGVSTEGGFTKRIKYEPTAFDREVAETAAPFISRSRNAAQNNLALGNEIERFATKEITPFLEANPRATNVQTIEKALREIPTPDLFKTDPVLERSYNLVRQKMINRIRASGGNTLDLWNARKEFDRDVIREFGGVAFDDAKATPIRRAIQDMRRGVNDFIGSQIGDDTFAQQMKRLSRLYEAQSRIAEANYKLLGSSKWKRWAQENPGKAGVIKYGGSAVLGGGITNLIIGN